jgi:KaiC/GvpD/RAD55 family RecA-like ATPase
MKRFKITCTEDNQIFVATSAFLKLCNKFKSLNSQKGRIIHITGSPGTGKSSNIYHAINLLNLKFYDVELNLSSVKLSPGEVLEEFVNTLKKDFNVKTKKDAYEELSKFDAILFADKLLDYGNLNKNRIELTEWLRCNRLKSIIFYIMVIHECLKHLDDLKRVNLIFHTTLTFILNKKKHDLLSDFSFLSKLFAGILKLFFEVVEIKYSETETIEIVKSHFEGINEFQIRIYIQKYGRRPRYILEAIENNLVTLNASHSNIKAVNPVCKPR